MQNAHQISYLEAVPALISPNGDNKHDSAAIRFGLLGEGKVTLDIRRDNPLGALVRTLIASETAVPGAITKVWDGKDNAQEVVSDGTYVARLSFASLGDVVDVQEESVQIVVDRNAPQVVIHSPVADFVTPLDSVRISATDLHASSTVKIYRSSGTNLSDWKLDAELTGDQREHTLFDLSDMEEGKYGVRVVATDLAENTTDVVKLFTVDKTAPVVSLAAPLANSYLSSRNGPVKIGGKVEETNLKSYALRLGEDPTSQDATVLLSGTTLALLSHRPGLGRVADPRRHLLAVAARHRPGWPGRQRRQQDRDRQYRAAGPADHACGRRLRAHAWRHHRCGVRRQSAGLHHRDRTGREGRCQPLVAAAHRDGGSERCHPVQLEDAAERRRLHAAPARA
ncbi:Ig-like domain-containing protein [Massilia sp. H-1]|nr:Ig-like domain-containing protein [Massilia sp. H-1]